MDGNRVLIRLSRAPRSTIHSTQSTYTPYGYGYYQNSNGADTGSSLGCGK